MLILAKAVLSMMIGFVISILIGLPVIPLMKKMKAGQKLSSYLEKKHKEKEGTPTMGGIIFIFPPLFLFFMLPPTLFFQKR